MDHVTEIGLLAIFWLSVVCAALTAIKMLFTWNERRRS